jgi:hypothetical protein
MKAERPGLNDSQQVLDLLQISEMRNKNKKEHKKLNNKGGVNIENDDDDPKAVEWSDTTDHRLYFYHLFLKLYKNYLEKFFTLPGNKLKELMPQEEIQLISYRFVIKYRT